MSGRRSSTDALAGGDVPLDIGSDADLLQAFARYRSEAAFTAFVHRHVDLVYSAALRRCGGDVHRAQDVVQLVFMAAAREAACLARHPAVSAWLHTTSRNAALNQTVSERRRLAREQHAMSDFEASEPEADSDWNEVRGILDATIDELSEADRVAVMLRFFESKSYAEIGAALNLSENSARMRTDRALEKLRTRLANRGIDSTAAALGQTLAARTVVAAPSHLAAIVAGGVVREVLGTAITLPGAGSRPWWAARPGLVVTLTSVALMTAVFFQSRLARSVPPETRSSAQPTSHRRSQMAEATPDSDRGSVRASRRPTEAAPTTGTVDGASVLLRPARTTLTAAQILRRMGNTYAGLKSYRDTGESMAKLGDKPLSDVSFEMYFVRGSKFRFESARQVGTTHGTQQRAVAIAYDGTRCLYYSGFGDASQFVTVERATATLSDGIVFGATYHVPRMLMPLQFSPSYFPLTELGDVRLLGEVDAEGAVCFVIEGTHPAGPTYNVWIGADDFLIRKIAYSSPLGFLPKSTRKSSITSANPEVVSVEERHRNIRTDADLPDTFFEIPTLAPDATTATPAR